MVGYSISRSVRTNTGTGAANIRPDDTVYADGGIVREGAVGDQGDGAYSAGRGGTGNIAGERSPQIHAAPHDEEIVPETAIRLAKEESHHVGRGGAGNSLHVHKAKEHEGKTLKEKLSGMFSKKSGE